MTEEWMDITPDVHFLQSIRGDKGSWWVLLAEAIDNSLDANASAISIRLSQVAVGISDNGIGITKDRERAMVRLGEHQPMTTTALGRFGIGFKYNAISAGDVLLIDSTSVDGRMSLRADWDKVLAGGRWRLPQPARTSIRLQGATGTYVSIEELRWPRPTPRDIARCQDKLAQLFYPALRDGRAIELNGKALPVLEDPGLSDVVDETVHIREGKGARVRGGYIVTPATQHHVQVSYRHRVILPDSTFGCDSYSGLDALFARVELLGQWELSRFKDDLNDHDRDRLEDAVLEVLRPILEKCHSAQFELNVEEATDQLNARLPPSLQAARPIRKQAKRKVKNRDTPKSRHNLTKEGTLGGPAQKLASPNQQLLICFERALCDQHGYGRVLRGRTIRIELARDNPEVAEWLTMSNKTWKYRALYNIAIMLYIHFCEVEPGQKPLPLDTEQSFGLRTWQVAQLQWTNQANEAEQSS